MVKLHATSVEIVSFRGIRKALSLDFGKRLTLVYGGNATGKSSIAQAIEFALTGQVVDHQDTPIPSHYLRNTNESQPGRVTLGVMGEGDEVELQVKASTDESRARIEQRFREVGGVDWPERQHLPITTTHITSQGALSRVLTSQTVTRNDLSGLCAGAYLRSLLGRAEKLADHFRQATAGRNIQAEIREARTALESAKILRDSLAATAAPGLETNINVESVTRALALEAGLVDVNSIDEMASLVDLRLDDTERKLGSVERLLVRTRDLGEYEVEVKQLQGIVDDSRRSEKELQEKNEQARARLDQYRKVENEALRAQVSANATMAAAEAYQLSVAAVDAASARLTQIATSLKIASEEIIVLEEKISSATKEQKEKSDRLVVLEAARRTQCAQVDAIGDCLAALNEIDINSLNQSKARLTECEEQVERLRREEAAAAAELRSAVEVESAAKRQLDVMSESDSRFLSAVSELKSFVRDDECSLCGHHHCTAEALSAAIASTTDGRLVSSTRHKEHVDRLSSARRDKVSIHSVLINQLAVADGALEQAIEVIQRLESRQRAILARAEESLTRVGLKLLVNHDALELAKNELIERIESIDQELPAARFADGESRAARSDLERELGDRSSEREQLTRLEANLQAQLSAIRANQPQGVSAEAVNAAHEAALATDRTLGEVRRDAGKINAQLAEAERMLAQSQAQGSGAARRLGAIQGLLDGLDSELAAVGATRDVGTLLQLEADTRQRRDEAIALKGRVSGVQRQLMELERYRAYTEAETKLSETQWALSQLMVRQTHLGKRAVQFAKLRRELEEVQGKTAEAVLRNVRDPVGVMFRAMTAGCQWDIEFALTDQGRVECKLLAGSHGSFPATIILNSAYINVAAIALRIALASQQNWTSLRTVVLDDPILEMDSLTQSALIDGLEAILLSPHSPWSDLQLIITTWSEDFAVLAAHKLAHMNDAASGRDDFVVYRLGALLDGSVVPERHVPRWRTQADAA